MKLNRMARSFCKVVLLLGLFTIGRTPEALLGQEQVTPPTGYVGGGIGLASPTGEFADNVGNGFAAALFGRIPIDEGQLFSLRADLGFVNYGNETIRICVTQPCRVTGDLTTSNNIFMAGIGPELGGSGGPVRIYTNGSVGFAYFATTSSVEGANDGEPFASDTNFEDLTFAWTLGGGLQFRLSSGTVPVFIDLGATYHGNGEAEYLRKGDIVDQPGGGVVLNPRRSETNLWTFQLGVAVGLGGRVVE